MKTLSEQVRKCGQGMLVAAMTPPQALEILQKADPAEIKRVLQQQKTKTAAGPKDLLAALLLLFPGALASAGGLDTLQLKLRNPAQIQMDDVGQINQALKTTIRQEVTEQVASVKKLIQDMKKNPGRAVAGAPMTLIGKKFTPDNEGQANVLRSLSRLEKAMGDNPMAEKTIIDFLAEAGIR